MNLLVLATAAEAESATAALEPFIAAGITAAVFIISAIVLRSFRDVAHRSAGAATTAADPHH
jgi:predicted permease